MALLDEAITRYRAFFETLTDETVEDLRILATPHVRYRDPTMDSKGIDAVTASMHKWFRDLDGIQFRITGGAVDGLVLYSHWIMTFRCGGYEQAGHRRRLWRGQPAQRQPGPGTLWRRGGAQ